MCDIDETFQRSIVGNLLKRFNSQYVALNTYVSEYMFEATLDEASVIGTANARVLEI